MSLEEGEGETYYPSTKKSLNRSIRVCIVTCSMISIMLPSFFKKHPLSKEDFIF